MTPTYLVADIGGTNARFAIASGTRDVGFSLENVRKLKTADFESLRDASHAYLESCAPMKIDGGCFAVAGPIGNGETRLTNAHWSLEPDVLAEEQGLEFLLAVNDFAAQARGALLAQASEIRVLSAGVPDTEAPCIVAGPGTGLGLGIVSYRAGEFAVTPAEGGHAGFAPRDVIEQEIARFLEAELGFVSWERILSGRGIVNLHRAMCAIEGIKWPGQSPQDVTAEALSQPTSLARRVIDRFWLILASFTGDAALMAGARGGVYLSGGIPPILEPILNRDAFVDRFAAHPPLSEYVSAIPVHLVLSGRPALLGAAALADVRRDEIR